MVQAHIPGHWLGAVAASGARTSPFLAAFLVLRSSAHFRARSASSALLKSSTSCQAESSPKSSQRRPPLWDRGSWMIMIDFFHFQRLPSTPIAYLYAVSILYELVLVVH